ncbi:divergent polysaccharide deacetylase family protein [Desulfobacula sp.]
MAVKKKTKEKTGSKPRTRRLKNKKPFILNEFKKNLVGIGILIFVCLTFAMGADLFFAPKLNGEKDVRIQQPSKQVVSRPIQMETHEEKPPDKITVVKEKSVDPIKYEVLKDIDHTIIKRPTPPEKDYIPKIAIIIDDIGYDKTIPLALCDLNSNITFSILPFAPFGKDISKKLHSKGSQLMLHMPMEPVDYPQINPGPGAILSIMSPDVLIDQVKKNIQNVPYIVGVNNHMGSKLTTHSDQMNQIFTILKKNNLFFVDSRTSAQSQCLSSARLLKIRFAHRDVFLDNVQNKEYIAGQLKKLVNLAKKHGSAIGIGHPYEATLEALSKQLPKLKNKVEIVRANVLTAIPG